MAMDARSTTPSALREPRLRRLFGWDRWNASIWTWFFPLALTAAVLFSAVNLSIQLNKARALLADASAQTARAVN
jgi:hypothetical protein